MAVELDNLDDVINQLAKMEKAVELEIIREARKRFRAVMKKLEKPVKSITPSVTGNLADSIKVQSRSRRGVSTVKLIWKLTKMPAETIKEFGGIKIQVDKQPKFINYSGIVNFKKDTKSEGFATDYWKKKQSQLDKEGAAIVKEVFKDVLEKHGVKVENK